MQDTRDVLSHNIADYSLRAEASLSLLLPLRHPMTNGERDGNLARGTRLWFTCGWRRRSLPAGAFRNHHIAVLFFLRSEDRKIHRRGHQLIAAVAGM